MSCLTAPSCTCPPLRAAACLGLQPPLLLTSCSCAGGGIPLIFPQYGRASGVAAYAGVGSGRVPTNGFLSMLHWSLADAGGSDPDALDPAPTVVLEAESTEATYAIWPYHFRASYTVRLLEEPTSEKLALSPG